MKVMFDLKIRIRKCLQRGLVLVYHFIDSYETADNVDQLVQYVLKFILFNYSVKVSRQRDHHTAHEARVSVA